jgi:hypothetical protein
MGAADIPKHHDPGDEHGRDRNTSEQREPLWRHRSFAAAIRVGKESVEEGIARTRLCMLGALSLRGLQRFIDQAHEGVLTAA